MTRTSTEHARNFVANALLPAAHRRHAWLAERAHPDTIKPSDLCP